MTPLLIQRVGHVRVFAALGSFMSAGLIAFTLLAEPWAWTMLRVLVGFCMSGIYVTAESWLNDAGHQRDPRQDPLGLHDLRRRSASSARRAC